VSRGIRFGPDYRASLDREGVRPGSQAARSIGHTIGALADEDRLPGPDDAHGMAPSDAPITQWAHARLVPRTGGLWLWYGADDATLDVLAVGRV
jgi:hypothetical protein